MLVQGNGNINTVILNSIQDIEAVRSICPPRDSADMPLNTN